jgi:hypothetical protein
MQDDQSPEQLEAKLRVAFGAASERLAAEVNNATQIIATRLDLLRRNLNSRDEKQLNQWIEDIATALKRIKSALEEHMKARNFRPSS